MLRNQVISSLILANGCSKWETKYIEKRKGSRGERNHEAQQLRQVNFEMFPITT